MYKPRLVTKDDENTIYNLINELEDKPLSFPDFTKAFHLNLKDPSIVYYVMLDKDKIIGFISIHIQILLHHVSKIAEIQELIVAKEYQGKGIGTKLFDIALKVAQDNNCTQIEVCCNQKRQRSHEFYLKVGMENSHYKFCLPIDKDKRYV
ncbi:MAG: family N-acetyltransferase [Anaerocolumna sp.]|jgi:PhnO protein|nr:family N-acetyltransferase [Anaerocolumna sp.]